MIKFALRNNLTHFREWLIKTTGVCVGGWGLLFHRDPRGGFVQAENKEN